MKRIIPIIIILFLYSCKPQKEIIHDVIEKTQYIDNVKYDSIIVHEFTDRFIKGDTVFINDEKITYKYKYISTHDTVSVTDTINKIEYIQTENNNVNNKYIYRPILLLLVLFFFIIYMVMKDKKDIQNNLKF